MMGFNPRGVLLRYCNQLFREKGKKLKNRRKSKNLFLNICIREAPKIKNVMIFGFLVQFLIEWSIYKLNLGKFWQSNLMFPFPQTKIQISRHISRQNFLKNILTTFFVFSAKNTPRWAFSAKSKNFLKTVPSEARSLQKPSLKIWPRRSSQSATRDLHDYGNYPKGKLPEFYGTGPRKGLEVTGR